MPTDWKYSEDQSGSEGSGDSDAEYVEIPFSQVEKRVKDSRKKADEFEEKYHAERLKVLKLQKEMKNMKTNYEKKSNKDYTKITELERMMEQMKKEHHTRIIKAIEIALHRKKTIVPNRSMQNFDFNVAAHEMISDVTTEKNDKTTADQKAPMIQKHPDLEMELRQLREKIVEKENNMKNVFEKNVGLENRIDKTGNLLAETRKDFYQMVMKASMATKELEQVNETKNRMEEQVREITKINTTLADELEKMKMMAGASENKNVSNIKESEKSIPRNQVNGPVQVGSTQTEHSITNLLRLQNAYRERDEPFTPMNGFIKAVPNMANPPNTGNRSADFNDRDRLQQYGIRRG